MPIRPISLVCASLVILTVLGHVSQARAWTEAGVTSVRADVDVRNDAHVHVRLDLAVFVRGGVLHELEVAGLEPDPVLDSSVRPTLVSAAGQAFETTTTVDPSGKIVLRFPGRDGPGRGAYRIALAYDATLPRDRVRTLERGDTRYAYVLPGWQTGLDGVVVTLHAPAGAVLVETDTATTRYAETRRESTDTGVRYELHRAHLPRTVAWPIEFDLPRESVPAALRGEMPSTEARASLRGAPAHRPDPRAAYVLALAFAVVALAKRHAFDREARLRNVYAVPLLVPLRHVAAHAVFVVLACVVAANTMHAYPEVAFLALLLVVLANVVRTARREGASRLGGFRPATTSDLAAARRSWWAARISWLSALDAREPLGWLVFGVIAVAVVRLELAAPAASRDAVFSTWHALVLLVALFSVRSREALPSTAIERLDALRRVAGRMRFAIGTSGSMAIRLAVHCDARGVLQDARIRLVTPHRAHGLLRLDVALVDRAALGAFERTPTWLCVVRAGSEADRLLGLESTRSRTAPGGRRARLLAFDRRAFDVIGRLTRPTTIVEAPRSDVPSSAASAESVVATASYALQ